MTRYVQGAVAQMETPFMAWFLVGVSFMFILAYGYFVNGAIANIVATKSMQNEIASLTSTVGALEGAYLAAQSSLTPEYAESLGFKASSTKVAYITKSTESFSFNR